MSKKPAPAKTDAAPKKKRSPVKLALFALVPLLAAGGAYAGWTHYAGAPAEGADAHDDIIVAAVPLEIAAETSFTHTFALSVIAAKQCGAVSAPALKAASEEEAHADGMLVNLSWMAAARRIDVLSEQSCGMLRSEILAAEAKADRLAESIPEPGKPAGH